jgi:pimeloyl-ACP methyl ester carboxylesterase
MWAYQIADLADRYRIVVYDQRGHGASARTSPTSMTIATLGDDLHDVLRACVPIGEKAVLAGHSMGGISIMSWAARHPHAVADRAAAAVLINTAANRIPDHIPLHGGPRRARRAAPLLVRRSLLTLVHRRARLPIRYLALGDHADAGHLDAIMEMLAQAPPATLRRYITAFLAMDLADELPRLTVPASVVGGTRDRLLPPVHCTLLAERLPSLDRVVMVPGSGHMGPWEARETVSALLADVAQRHLRRP